MDPRKTITATLMAEAPGCATNVDPRLLKGHYQKAINAAKQIEQLDIDNVDNIFVSNVLQKYAETLLFENFWNLAHLAKTTPISDIDPIMANQMYQICTCIDELRALLYFESKRFGDP